MHTVRCSGTRRVQLSGLQETLSTLAGTKAVSSSADDTTKVQELKQQKIGK